MTSNSVTQIVTIVFISLGMGVMALSIFTIRQIFTLDLESQYSRNWRGLLFLVIFFLVGYLASLVLILVGQSSLLVIASGVIFLFGAMFVYLVGRLSYSTINNQIQTSNELRKTAAELKLTSQGLQDQQSTLETQVASRTVELEKRVKQLATISEVARAIAELHELADLLQTVANLISERFGFYHVGIFLIDDDRINAFLKASNSDGGKRMLARGHHLQVGQEGIVGYVTSVGQPRIATDVGADAIFFNNPDLPDTRSEMTLPLSVGNKIIGALDVQSKAQSAFSQEDADLMKTLADQVAIAIENTRLIQETRQALNEVRTVYRQYLRQEWGQLSPESNARGYRHSREGTIVLEEMVDDPEIKAAIETGEVVMNEESGQNLVVPIKLRGDVIGVLNLRQKTNARKWNQDDITLLNAVSERVALALENARLLQDAQRRATKERTVGEITAKFGSSINLRNILETAVAELGHVIPGSEISIQFQKNIES